MNLSQIITNIGNETITGKITHQSTRDISVEILSPYRNIPNGVHVPYFSRHLIEDNQVEPYAKSLLISTYNICQFAKENKAILLKRLEITNKEALKLNEMLNALSIKKIDLKNKFKREEINNIENQQQLIKLKREKAKIEFEIRQCWAKYFEYFPMIVPIDMRVDILGLIWSYKK